MQLLSRTLLFVGAVSSALIVGCSGDNMMPAGRKDRGVDPNFDAGMSSGDAGVQPGQDTGMMNTPDTGMMNAPDMGMMNTPDMGMNNPDQGMMSTPDMGQMMNPDMGMVTPDMGTPPGDCTMDSDCAGLFNNPVCLEPQTLTNCASPMGCVCVEGCDPYVPQAMSGCTVAGEVCTWLGAGNLPQAICLMDGGGGLQGQGCNADFSQNPPTNTCNRFQNAFCLGASMENPIGTCSQICNPNNDTLCPSLGNYTCNDLDDPAAGFGLCLEPIPNFTDVGNSCQVATDCQGGLCSQVLAGSCSATCGGLASCPANSVCLNLPMEGPSCTGLCNADPDCANRNPNTICENIAAAGEAPLNVCIPRCTQDAECGGPPATCNTMTGRCQ